VNTGGGVTFSIASDRNGLNLAIERAVRSSKTLGAFVQRDDVPQAFCQFYQSFSYSVDGLSSSDKKWLQDGAARMAYHDYGYMFTEPDSQVGLIVGDRSMALYYADQFALFSAVSEKLRGHEVQVLQSLVDRFHKVEAARLHLGDSEAYGAASSTGHELARSLMASLGENLAPLNLPSDTWESDMYSEIETFLARAEAAGADAKKPLSG
jgi:hypothetical protein